MSAGGRKRISISGTLSLGAATQRHIRGAKDAPQMPALQHGPRRTPLPSPAPYLLSSTISRFERKCGRGTLLAISAFTPQDRYIPEGPEKFFFSNSVPLSSYFIIARLSGMNRDAKEGIKYRAETEQKLVEPFSGGRWVDRRLWRNPQEKLKGLSLRR